MQNGRFNKMRLTVYHTCTYFMCLYSGYNVSSSHFIVVSNNLTSKITAVYILFIKPFTVIYMVANMMRIKQQVAKFTKCFSCTTYAQSLSRTKPKFKWIHVVLIIDSE